LVHTERLKKSLTERGILSALGSALLFGCGMPLAKMLLVDVSPWLMAALLYLGSGIGLGIYRLLHRMPMARLRRGEWFWLSAAIFAGGVLGPGLAMLGLTHMPASGGLVCLSREF
jgi:drug/metabolite transporter (DMT)-like permease